MSKVEVVRVLRSGDTNVVVQSKSPDGTLDNTPMVADMKLQKRMNGRQYQFFYGQRIDGAWKLGAYAPYQPW